MLPELAIKPTAIPAVSTTPPMSATRPGLPPLPRFSHIPPATVTGVRRWPSSLEAQSFPSAAIPVLSDILLWVTPFLSLPERTKVKLLATSYHLGPEYGPLWFTRPWAPNRRRRWGFGHISKSRTVVNDIPPKHLILHFVWQFLTPQDRFATSQTCPQWYLYQRLRWRALVSPVATLRHLRPSPGSPDKLPMGRALLNASALLIEVLSLISRLV
jgi:hypothetical protein